MNNRIPISVKDCRYPISIDIDPDARIDVLILDKQVAMCVAAASEALKSPSPTLTEFQRMHFSELFHSMKWTHASIRDLLRHETTKPMSVDAMSLVRTQLESLYAICLLVESPTYLSVYLKDSWKKLYIRFLLQREECQSLGRFSKYINEQAIPILEQMASLIGVSPDEMLTIDYDELGQSPPPGFVPKRISKFPSPRAIIRLTTDADRIRMLTRLYPEYQFLCSFVHVSPHPGMFKIMLDDRHPLRNLFKSKNMDHMFHGQIAGPALTIDLISVAQGCAEILTHCRSNLDLLKAIEGAWKVIADSTLLGRVIWEIRTRKLLGVIG